MFKVGDKLIATNPCYMSGDVSNPSLIVGEEYNITRVESTRIYIVDMVGDAHAYRTDCKEEGVMCFFKITPKNNLIGGKLI